jgi:hypothetical protein
VATIRQAPKPPAPGATTDAALIAAVKNAETAAIAAGAPAKTVLAVGTAAARKARPSLSAANAQSIALSAAQAIAGQSGTTTWGQITGDPVGAFKTGVGMLGVGGWVGDVFKVLVPILKVGAGGAGLLVSGVALIYLAGKNVGADKAVRTAVNPSRALTRKVARTVAPERHEARAIAKRTRSTERTERARSRVVSETTKRGGTRVRVSSRREAAGARSAGAEYRAQAGQRSRERLSALRGERARRAAAPRLHSGSQS